MYKRLLLKLSGEALKNEDNSMILSGEKLKHFGAVIKTLHDNGFEICCCISFLNPPVY